MAKNINRLRRLCPNTTAFMLVDIQEKFRPAMPMFECMLANVNKLVKAGKALDVPLFVSEQYPKGLGKTVKDLDIGHACMVLEKTRFSGLPQFKPKMEEVFGGKPDDVVLFGLESHVCIEQTAMELIESEINVLVVADCCSSRLNQDRDLAFKRLQQIGCIITTSESVIFNLLEDKDNPKFNSIRKLVAEPSVDMELAYHQSSKL